MNALALSDVGERTEFLRSISDSLCELTETIARAGQSGPLATLTGNIAAVPTITTIYNTAAEAEEMLKR